MAGQDYRDRLARARMVWSAFMLFIWIAYMLSEGFSDGWVDVTGFLAIIWGLGFPRNMAKRLAKRAERLRDLNAAIDDELR